MSVRSLVKAPGQVEKARWWMESRQLWARPRVVLMPCSKGCFVDVAACCGWLRMRLEDGE